MLTLTSYPRHAIYMSATEVWQLLGVRPATLRQWATRGHVDKVGRDSYDMGSIMEHMSNQRDNAAS